MSAEVTRMRKGVDALGESVGVLNATVERLDTHFVGLRDDMAGLDRHFRALRSTLAPLCRRAGRRRPPGRQAPRLLVGPARPQAGGTPAVTFTPMRAQRSPC